MFEYVFSRDRKRLDVLVRMSDAFNAKENFNMKGRLFVVRHGESEALIGARTKDTASIPLTKKGRRQAGLAGIYLRQDTLLTWETLPTFVAYSPYERAKDTAFRIIPRLDTLKQIAREEWPDLREFTYLNPISYHETTWDEREAGRRTYWERADPNHHDHPTCDSFNSLIERVLRTVHRADQLRLTHERVILVCHADWIRAAIWSLSRERLSHTREEMRDYERFRSVFVTPPAGIIELTISESVSASLAELHTQPAETSSLPPLKDVYLKYAQGLSSYPGVSGVSLARTTGGSPCIRVHMQAKASAALTIPSEIDGYPVIVERERD